MTGSPTASLARISPESAGQAGRQAGDSIVCPVDITPRAMLEVLRDEYGRGNLSTGRVHVMSDGRVMLGLVLKDGSAYKPAETKAELAARWMHETRVLLRKEFFARCSFSGNSADLHSRAIRILYDADAIKKENKLWIWKDLE